MGLSDRCRRRSQPPSSLSPRDKSDASLNNSTSNNMVMINVLPAEKPRHLKLREMEDLQKGRTFKRFNPNYHRRSKMLNEPAQIKDLIANKYGADWVDLRRNVEVKLEGEKKDKNQYIKQNITYIRRMQQRNQELKSPNASTNTGRNSSAERRERIRHSGPSVAACVYSGREHAESVAD